MSLFSVLRMLRRRHDFEDGMAEEMRFHIEQYTADLVQLRRAAGGSGTPRAPGVRQPRQRQDRLPRGARPAPVRRASSGSALRRPPDAQDAGLHGHRPGHPGALHRREPDHLRRRRFGAAPPAAVPGRRPSDERVQHLSQGRRPQRRLLAAELLRAPGAHRRLLGAGGLPRRHGGRGRNGHDGADAGLAGLPGFLLHPGARPGEGARVYGGGDRAGEKRRGHPHGQLLAAAPGRRPARARPRDPRQRHLQDRGRGLAARLQLPLVPGADLPPTRVEPGRARAPGSAIRGPPT